MDEPVPVDFANYLRQANGNAQQASQIEHLPSISQKVPFQNQVQGFTAWVLQYENRLPFVTSERQRLGCPRRIEFGCEQVFVFEPPRTSRRRSFSGRRNCQHRRWVAA